MSIKKTYFAVVVEKIAKLSLFWLYGVALLSIFRAIMVFIFWEKISVENPNFIDFFITGFTFDTNIVMSFLLIPFLMNFLPLSSKYKSEFSSKMSYYFIILFNVIALFLSIITPTYFKEYNDQFNYFLFEGLYDDKIAIAKTVVEEYNPFLSLIIFLFLLLITSYIIKKIDEIDIDFYQLNNLKSPMKIISFVVIIALAMFALRGALWLDKPAMRKWAYVTNDDFLNKIVINPIKSLLYAYKDYSLLHNIDRKNPYLSKDSVNLVVTKDSILRVVKSEKKLNANHIILTVMESYDSWPLEDKFADLHVSDNLRYIASRGVHLKNFLPSSPNTMNSLGSIISGLPYMGVNISLLKGAGESEITSIFRQFKELGYETSFFYGGLSSWQNIGKFVKTQGVDHLYTSLDIDDNNSKNIWGVNDDKLFELVTKSLKDRKKSFSIVMTTSYHPPFTLDVYKYGYKYHDEKDYPKKYQHLYDGSLKPNVLGHLWYSDKVLGEFVKSFEEKNPNTLFLFTGDHFGRRYFNSKPNLYESSSVPLILYGCGVEKFFDNRDISANHMNIMPTLFELVAPMGFKYYSFVKPIGQKSKDDLVVTYKKMMRGKILYEVKSKNILKKFQGDNTKVVNLNLKEVKSSDEINVLQEYNQKMARYWDATINGIK